MVSLSAVSTSTRGSERNHQFDLLRIIFATVVLLSHAAEITDGNTSREVLHRLTGSMTFGELGVDGFFVLSGYLIVQSWLGNPELLDFLRKRALRILPGYFVAVAAGTVAVGLLAPGVPHFFRRFDVHFLTSIALLTSPATPAVFPGQPYATVNGAMYTIAYEFRCYLLVAVLGMCGLLRRPWLILAIAVALLSAVFYPPFLEAMHWPRRVQALVGEPFFAFRLTAIYLIGCCFYLLRSRLSYRRLFAGAAIVALAAFFVWLPSYVEVALVTFGSYLLFYLGQLKLPWLAGMRRFPDISYGIYLYGWPVESLWIWFHHGSPWGAFVGSAVICFGLGWLSWHFVERPALKLKRHTTVALPAA